MQGYAALAIPFDASNFGAAEPTRAIDADAKRSQPQRRLHGPLHGTAESDATLELLGNGLRHQGGIDLGLSHLDDVEMHFRRGQLCQFAAQLRSEERRVGKECRCRVWTYGEEKDSI